MYQWRPLRKKAKNERIQGASLRGRPSPPAALAQEGKIEINILNYVKRTKVHDRLYASWRLECAKNPAAMIQENNPDATCMSIPRT